MAIHCPNKFMQLVPVMNISIKGKNTVFNFTEVSEVCIDSIIKNMKSKSSTGYDNISNKLIKSAKDVLIKPLTLLMNQIIYTGEFPKQLKIAKVKPLFKKGNQSSFTNFRPILSM